jgi:hypothetical protein
VYIFSDGRFEDVKGFSLGNLKPVYVPFGSFDAENVAITAFSTRRSESKPEERQAFAQVTNYTEEPRKVTVQVLLDGNFFDAKDVDIPAGESAGVAFALTNSQPGELTAELKGSAESASMRDVLAQDDSGYAALNDAKPGRVLVVTPGNVALEVALATERAGKLGNIEFKTPDVLTTEEYKRDTDASAYNLVIYDQCAPPAMPRANTLIIGRVPPDAAWHGDRDDASDESDSAAETDGKADQKPADTPPNVANDPDIIDWDRSHPLLANVELGNVLLEDSIVLDPPAGATVLIDSTAGPIAAIAPRDAYQDAVLGFEIFGTDKDGARTVNTNWPRFHSFPTFCLNMLEHLAGSIEDSQLATVRPGRPVALRTVGNAAELTVVDPAGQSHTVKRTSEDIFPFHDTNLLGVYDVRRGDQVIERFAVNLFDRQESDVRVRETQDPEANVTRAADIRIGHVDVKAEAGRAPTRKEVWKAVLACALAVLVVEWYIYNRRVYL